LHSVRRTRFSQTIDSDGHTTVLSPRLEANINQVITIISRTHTHTRTRTTRQRTRRGAGARTMPGNAAAALLPRARIHTYTSNTNTTPTPVRRRPLLRRAILTFAQRQLAHRTTVPHVRTGKRWNWTVSIASLGLRGQRNSSVDSSSLSPSSAPWGKVEGKQRCQTFHTHGTH
jgi:hypothetical protein